MRSGIDLDNLDRRILRELQQDASQPMRRIAERVNSTPATCHRRYQRLLRSGAIKKTIAIADPSVSGEAITTVIGVTLTNQQQSSQRLIRDFVTKHAEILMAWMTTGEFDYVFILAFQDSKSYADFLDQNLQTIPVLDRYRSFISVDELKFNPIRFVSA